MRICKSSFKCWTPVWWMSLFYYPLTAPPSPLSTWLCRSLVVIGGGMKCSSSFCDTFIKMCALPVVSNAFCDKLLYLSILIFKCFSKLIFLKPEETLGNLSDLSITGYCALFEYWVLSPVILIKLNHFSPLEIKFLCSRGTSCSASNAWGTCSGKEC